MYLRNCGLAVSGEQDGLHLTASVLYFVLFCFPTISVRYLRGDRLSFPRLSNAGQNKRSISCEAVVHFLLLGITFQVMIQTHSYVLMTKWFLVSALCPGPRPRPQAHGLAGV